MPPVLNQEQNHHDGLKFKPHETPSTLRETFVPQGKLLLKHGAIWASKGAKPLQFPSIFLNAEDDWQKEQQKLKVKNIEHYLIDFDQRIRNFVRDEFSELIVGVEGSRTRRELDSNIDRFTKLWDHTNNKYEQWLPGLFQGLFQGTQHYEMMSKNPTQYGKILTPGMPLGPGTAPVVIEHQGQPTILEIPIPHIQKLLNEKPLLPANQIAVAQEANTAEIIYAQTVRREIQQNDSDTSVLSRARPTSDVVFQIQRRIEGLFAKYESPEHYDSKRAQRLTRDLFPSQLDRKEVVRRAELITVAFAGVVSTLELQKANKLGGSPIDFIEQSLMRSIASSGTRGKKVPSTSITHSNQVAGVKDKEYTQPGSLEHNNILSLRLITNANYPDSARILAKRQETQNSVGMLVVDIRLSSNQKLCAAQFVKIDSLLKQYSETNEDISRGLDDTNFGKLIVSLLNNDIAIDKISPSNTKIEFQTHDYCGETPPDVIPNLILQNAHNVTVTCATPNALAQPIHNLVLRGESSELTFSGLESRMVFLEHFKSEKLSIVDSKIELMFAQSSEIRYLAMPGTQLKAFDFDGLMHHQVPADAGDLKRRFGGFCTGRATLRGEGKLGLSTFASILEPKEFIDTDHNLRFENPQSTALLTPEIAFSILRQLSTLPRSQSGRFEVDLRQMFPVTFETSPLSTPKIFVKKISIDNQEVWKLAKEASVIDLKLSQIVADIVYLYSQLKHEHYYQALADNAPSPAVPALLQDSFIVKNGLLEGSLSPFHQIIKEAYEEILESEKLPAFFSSLLSRPLSEEEIY